MNVLASSMNVSYVFCCAARITPSPSTSNLANRISICALMFGQTCGRATRAT